MNWTNKMSNLSFSKILGLVLVGVMGSCILHAQIITGRIIDAKTTEPLPFVNVFINNTTLGTVTDQQGYFTLKGIKDPGNYEVVFSFVGYETHKTKVTIAEGAVSVDIITLKPSETELSTIEVTGKRDKQWEKDLRKFKSIFLGTDKLAEDCEIINPWVIDFPKDNVNNRFLAKASAPIGIENKALGYRVIFYLTDFQYDSKAYSIIGNAKFSELKSYDLKEMDMWEENRASSYRQSVHYLFKTILDKRVRAEGFALYKDVNFIDNAITRSSIFNADLGKTVIEYDTASLITATKQADVYKISIKNRMEVHDTKVRAPYRIYQDVFGTVSWISLRNNSVLVSKEGFPLHPEDVIVSGDLSNKRLASMLPLNYKPKGEQKKLDEINGSMFQEQVYVHTDRSYYYPGETIWFKGYVNYATPAWRDSLSSTGYVELIDEEKKTVVYRKTVPIARGVFISEFPLADTLSAKNYYLRAYTNFNRNFGDKHLYTLPIPVLSKQEIIKPISAMEKTSSNNHLSVGLDKNSYKPLGLITLTLQLNQEEQEGNFSMAVVDSRQTESVRFANNIVDGFPLRSVTQENKAEKFPFAVERGITFHGRFLNEKGKPGRASLTVLQLASKQFMTIESDERGHFTVDGPAFHNSASFSIQATDTRGKSYGKVELIETVHAPIGASLQKPYYETAFRTPLADFNQDLRNDARMLEEVLIKSEKEVSIIKRPYGSPDYVIRAKDLNTSYGNLLQTLPGKVPGLVVRDVVNFGEIKRVVYIERSGMTGSLQLPKEVIVTVNDVRLNGTPEEILSSIDPATVESVEVKTGVNVLYGADGGGGIVAVYTNEEVKEIEGRKNFQVLKVKGYSPAAEFEGLRHANPELNTDREDKRSTLYWNPMIRLDKETRKVVLQFYASDSIGPYRVEVEGVLQNGEPVRIVEWIQIEE